MRSGDAIDDRTVVLIIENIPEERRMLREICHEAGFAMRNILDVDFEHKRLTEALQQAVGMVNRGEVDLVLLDLELEKGTGDPTPAIALIERWKDETRKKTVPLIVVSAFTHLLRQAALESCEAVIRKPGSGESDRICFSDFLTHAIRKAIIRRENEVTVTERFGKMMNSITKSKVEDLTIELPYNVKVKLSSLNLAPVLFIAGCVVVAGWAWSKSGTVSPRFALSSTAVGFGLLLFLGMIMKVIQRSR